MEFVGNFNTLTFVTVHIYKKHKKCSGDLVGLVYCLIFRIPGTSKFTALLTISHQLREDEMKLFDGKYNR